MTGSRRKRCSTSARFASATSASFSSRCAGRTGGHTTVRYRWWGCAPPRHTTQKGAACAVPARSDAGARGREPRMMVARASSSQSIDRWSQGSSLAGCCVAWHTGSLCASIPPPCGAKTSRSSPGTPELRLLRRPPPPTEPEPRFGGDPDPPPPTVERRRVGGPCRSSASPPTTRLRSASLSRRETMRVSSGYVDTWWRSAGPTVSEGLSPQHVAALAGGLRVGGSGAVRARRVGAHLAAPLRLRKSAEPSDAVKRRASLSAASSADRSWSCFRTSAARPRTCQQSTSGRGGVGGIQSGLGRSCVRACVRLCVLVSVRACVCACVCACVNREGIERAAHRADELGERGRHVVGPPLGLRHLRQRCAGIRAHARETRQKQAAWGGSGPMARHSKGVKGFHLGVAGALQGRDIGVALAWHGGMMMAYRGGSRCRRRAASRRRRRAPRPSG